MTDAHPASDDSPQAHIAEIRQRWEAVQGFPLGYPYIGAAPIDIAFLLDAYATLEASNAALRARLAECEAALMPLADDFDAYIEACAEERYFGNFQEWAHAWRDHETLSDTAERLHGLYKQAEAADTDTGGG